MVGFDVLGQVRLRSRDDGETAGELAAMLQRLLGLLLARAGRPIDVDAIAEVLWEGAPPRTARKTVQIYIHRLRRALGDDNRVVFSDSGYRLIVAEGELDAHAFEALVAQAATAKERGQPAMADRLLERALALWRGPAYAGLRHISDIAAEAARLDERRLVVFEDRVAIELDLGRHAELAGKLGSAIAQNPYRERLRGQLMLALYRDGRQAEALEAYRQTRELLVAEFGVEPNAQLQQLHQAILRGDPALPQAPAAELSTGRMRIPTGYRFLPRDIPDFTGREEGLRWLDEIGDGSASTMVITAIAGAAGIGKTALAVHWAHRAAGRFPDGQLYVNLRGYDTARPLRPIEALAHLLRCLGVPREQLPTEPEEAAARYRALLAERRMLVVLDNARAADQVRPLLPGNPACQVLVTSRDRLSGLIAHDGAQRLTLGLLPHEQALALLRKLIGTSRVDSEPDGAAALVGLCAGLPLAVRVVAAHLADRPGVRLAAFADEVARGGRLAALTVAGDEDRAVHTVLGHSYDALDPAVRRVFRLLGLMPGPDFTPAATAALMGAPLAQAASALDTLAAAHLVEQPAPGRYAFHDLVREYARGRCDDAGALRGLLEYLRDMVVTAHSFIASAGEAPKPELHPRIASAADAMAWFEVERGNLTAAITAAMAAGETELACDIAQPLGQFFHFTGHTSDWVTLFENVYAAIEHLGETKAKYFLLNSLGNAYSRAGHYDEAIDALQRSVEGRESLGEHVAAGSSKHNLAANYERLGRYEEAQALWEDALATFQKHEARGYESLTLGSGLSNIYQRMGMWDKALDSLLQALVIDRELGAPLPLIRTLNNLGETYRHMGRLALAQQVLAEALELATQVGDRYTESLILGGLADVQGDLGNYDEAIRMREDALEMVMSSVGSHESDMLNNLGDLYAAAGQPDQALDRYEKALVVARDRGERHQHGRALAAIGRITGSREHLWEALALLEPISALEAQAVRESLRSIA